ncbi:MAG TPA: DoxX family protein [Chryseosolibacter sp.]
MKKTNVLYWVFTGIFGAFMLFTAIPDIIVVPEAVEMVSGQLGYPKYLIPFLGVAKALGVIAIVIPGFPRIKEWAYAGLFFDLVGATYSAIAVGGFEPAMLGMIPIFAFLFLSYAYYHRRRNEKSGAPEGVPAVA